MKYTYHKDSVASVWGFEITPQQLGLTKYKHRIVFDLGTRSLAIEWGKR